jgi:hydroxyethylthiazole kinase
MDVFSMKTRTLEALAEIRCKAPLVHNITNLVVMNSSANILLALGASPVMAHCQSEIREMTSLASALVLNIGTLQEDWLESMHLAAETANALGIPVILDPVGAGATRLRTQAVKNLLNHHSITVLRGNCSEIFSLGSADIQTRGVDSSLSFTDEMVDGARQMARDLQCILAISGKEDCITDGSNVFRVNNGQPLMTRVTGIGCGLSAVVAAFCAVEKEDMARATASAFGYYGLCADLAIQISNKPGSFYTAFLDCLYTTGPDEIQRHLNVRKDQ